MNNVSPFALGAGGVAAARRGRRRRARTAPWRSARMPAPPSTEAPPSSTDLSTRPEPVYGVSTGFGALANTVIPPERSEELQLALIRSHAAGLGAEVEREVVRAMMLLRARSLSMGYSGARACRRRVHRGVAQRRHHADRSRVRLARSQRRSGSAGLGGPRAAG